MKPVDVNDYLTITAAMKALGCPRRTLARVISRAEAAGKNVTEEILGRVVIHKSKVDLLKQFYYPRYSEAHQKMVKKWGAAGGRQKGINYAKKA